MGIVKATLARALARLDEFEFPEPINLEVLDELKFPEPINLELGRVFYILEESFVGRLVIGEKLGENAEAELYSARVNQHAVEKIADWFTSDTKLEESDYLNKVSGAQTKNFVLKEACNAPCGLKNSAKGGESSNPSAVLSESEKIEHVDFKVDADPVTNPRIAANKIDGKLEENDYLNKAVKADANGCDSTSQPSEELDGSHECTEDMESEDEGLSSGSSSESQAEVTGDSPGHKTTSNCVGRKRLYGSIDEDDIITMLAPLLKQQIEDALKSTLLPLVAILRSREEDEQKHRVQMLALEEQKLALKKEKLLFKRRRVDRT